MWPNYASDFTRPKRYLCLSKIFENCSNLSRNPAKDMVMRERVAF